MPASLSHHCCHGKWVSYLRWKLLAKKGRFNSFQRVAANSPKLARLFFWAQIQQTALNWNAEKSSFWALKSSFWASKSSFWTFKSSFWTFKTSFWAFGSNFDVILCFSLIFGAKLVFLTFWRQLLPGNGKIWGVLEASLWPKIEFFDFWNRVFGKNRVFGLLKKSSFCQNAQKKSLQRMAQKGEVG